MLAGLPAYRVAMAGRSDPNALLRAAEAHYVAGRHGAALPLVEQVLLVAPGHPAVLHLKGLLLSGLDRRQEARIVLEAAQRAAPADPQIANNLGNLLGRLGDPTAALAAYDAAVRAAPGFNLARRNRAITIGELGRTAEARADFADLTRIDPTDIEARVAWGLLEREAGDVPAAVAQLDAALALDPVHRTANLARLRIAIDRDEPDAERRLLAALDDQPDDPDLLVAHLAIAAGAAREETRSRILLRLAREPDWIAGHEAVAEAGWADGTRPTFSFEKALAERPGDATLWRAYVGTLARSDAYAEAAAACLEAEAATGLTAFAAAAFAHLGAAGATPEADRVLARLPDRAVGTDALAKHRLRGGDPAGAAQLLERHIAAEPNDIEAWALLGIAWELTDNARAEWLHGQTRLIAIQDLGLSEAMRDDLVAMLRALHGRSHLRLGQSVRGGTQTAGDLLDRDEPILRLLRQRIAAAVEDYRNALPPIDPAHPLLRHRGDAFDMTGSWSIRLTGRGYHVQHIHPKGLVSAASWWVLPDVGVDTDETAGWFAVGGAPAHLRLDLPPRRLIEPRVGHLVLFPSTLHHGTRPFAAGERISVAFDLAARG